MLEERLFDYKLTFKIISLIRNLKKSSDPRHEELSKIMADTREEYKKRNPQSDFDTILEGSRAVLNYLKHKYDDLYAHLQKQLVEKKC